MNELTMRPDRLERLRKICLALPDATEKIAWGDPTWRVRDKIFAMAKGNYPGGRPSVWMKGRDGTQESLIALDPDGFFVPPYVGHKGWIGVWMDRPRIKWSMLEDLIAESYTLVAKPRKRKIGVRAHFPASRK
ncbi:MAG TPA: MmcQ/YjbR family DNA-binding protein [Gammaproteobacteria bacterium]